MTIGLLFMRGIAPASWVPGVRPFTANSAVNTAIDAAAPRNPLTWDLDTGFNYGCIPKKYIDIPNLATAPTCSFTTPGALGYAAGTIVRQMTHGFSGAERLNGNSVFDDEAVSVIGSDGEGYWLFTRLTDTTASAVGASAGCDLINSDGFGTAGVKASGVVGALCSDLVGLLVKEELTQTGAFNHMICIAGVSAYVNSGNPIPPVIASDGSSFSGHMVNGTVLTFPPGTVKPGGLDPITSAIWDATANYGILVVDNGGNTAFYAGMLYDQTRGAASLPFSAATSWSAADIGTISSACALIVPLLWKVGFPLDAFGNILSLIGTCGPQTQFNGNLASTLMTVKRDSDSTPQNISTTNTAAGLLNTTALASFCSGTTGRVTTYNNQSDGIVNFTSAGSTDPIIYTAGALETINGKPAVRFNGTTNWFKETGLATGSGVYWNDVIQLDDLSADYAIFGSDASGGLAFKINATTGVPELYTNTGTLIGIATAAITAGSPYLLSATYIAGTSWSISINGQGAGAGTTAVTATSGNVLIGSATAAGTTLFKGLMGAWTICNSAVAVRPTYSIENGLVNFWGPMGTFTRSHTTIVHDTFTDTNGVLLGAHAMNTGAGWTDVTGNHAIQSNTAVPNTFVGSGIGVALSTFAGALNGIYTCDVTAQQPNADSNIYYPYLIFRYVDANNYSQCIIQFTGGTPSAVVVTTVNGGVATNIIDSPFSPVSGTAYTVALSFYGANIDVSINGTHQASGICGDRLLTTTCGIQSVKQFAPSGPTNLFDNLTLTT